jgi:hypothetical protein
MDPINYMGAVPQLDIGKQFLSGLQAGSALGSIENTAEKQRLALAAAKQYQTDLQGALANPNPQAFAALALKYPAQREAVKQSWDQLSDADRKQEGDTMAQSYSALLSGKPEIAKQVVQAQIDARKNAGLDTSHYDNALALLDADPQKAQAALGFTLAHINDPKAFATQFGALGGEQRAQEQAPAKLREAVAEAGKSESEATLKQLGVVGQTLGALQGKKTKPEQVAVALKSLAAKGVIGKDQLAEYLAAVPTDPAQLNEWLGSMQAAGMKPDDQMKFTTPDANTKANNARIAAEGAANRQNALDVQDKIDARQEKKGSAEASLDADTLTTMAQQYLAGDKSVMQNLGRGTQGSANIVALRQEITRQAKEQGLTGPQIAAKMADYAGLTAGLRTSANISARVENAISEAKELAPLAIEAGRLVSRSGFLPFGKAGIMFDTQTNNPNLKKFATANNGLVSAYAGAMARGQKPTVSDYDHAREILAAAQSQQAYEATVNQMFAEMEAASRAPQNVRNHLRSEIGGGHGAAAPPATNAKGWALHVDAKGNKAYVSPDGAQYEEVH